MAQYVPCDKTQQQESKACARSVYNPERAALMSITPEQTAELTALRDACKSSSLYDALG